MKKRWISLILVICFVVALLPTFVSAARPEGNEDGFQSVGSRTWNPNDIANWAPSAEQNAYGSAGHYLYYKDGDDYRLLTVNDDPYYYSSVSRTISSTFSDKPSNEGDKNFEKSTDYYVVDQEGNGHRIYYNSNHFNYTWIMWVADGHEYKVELYYYVNSENTTGEVTGTNDSGNTSMQNAINNGTVRLIDASGNTISDTSVRWPFGYGTGTSSAPSGTAQSVSNIYTRKTANRMSSIILDN